MAIIAVMALCLTSVVEIAKLLACLKSVLWFWLVRFGCSDAMIFQISNHFDGYKIIEPDNTKKTTKRRYKL